MPTSDEVEAVFRRLIPAEARVVAVAVTDAPADWPIPPDLAKAVTARQREFIAGRWCAARALAQLGVTGSVGRRADRAPAWPLGAVGSISHTRVLAVAAVGRVAAIGIDLEPIVSAAALADLRVSAIDDAEWKLVGDVERATALFSAKETIFKARFPVDGVFLEFTDARLKALDSSTLTLDVKGSIETVRYAVEHGHAFTALVRAEE